MSELIGMILVWGVFACGLLLFSFGEYDATICVLLMAIYLRLEA